MKPKSIPEPTQQSSSSSSPLESWSVAIQNSSKVGVQADGKVSSRVRICLSRMPASPFKAILLLVYSKWIDRKAEVTVRRIHVKKSFVYEYETSTLIPLCKTTRHLISRMKCRPEVLTVNSTLRSIRYRPSKSGIYL